jgi:hypothetical protein
VFEALFAFSVVPVESFNCLYHTIRIPIVCTNVHTSNHARLPPATRESPCEPLFQRSRFQNSSAGEGRSLAIGPAVQIDEFNSGVFGGARQWVILTHYRRPSTTASGAPSTLLGRRTRRMACEHRSFTWAPSGTTTNVAKIARRQNHLRPMRATGSISPHFGAT